MNCRAMNSASLETNQWSQTSFRENWMEECWQNVTPLIKTNFRGYKKVINLQMEKRIWIHLFFKQPERMRSKHICPWRISISSYSHTTSDMQRNKSEQLLSVSSPTFSAFPSRERSENVSSIFFYDDTENPFSVWEEKRTSSLENCHPLCLHVSYRQTRDATGV